MKRLTTLLLPVAAILLCLLPCGCVDEESTLGVNLVDSTTLYNGQTATLTADRALSVRDDSLLTTNYSFGIIGNYNDATFGRVSSILYTQIALDQNTSTINLESNIIDSVVLSLTRSTLYPDSTATYNFHFEVMHLAEPLDTSYYSTDALPVDPAGLYFDGDVRVSPTDTVIRLKLDNSIASILNQSASADEFAHNAKGLRIRLTDAGDEGMLGINFKATKTCLTVYHRYDPADTVDAVYTFLMGTGTSRFTQFVHDYTGSTTGGADSLDGSTTLYLEPLGGYNILLSFNNAVRAFAEAHPTAILHHAELLMPVTYTGRQPDRILALSKKSEGNDVFIDDYVDPYTLAGFDGTYDEARGCFRLRVTQHVQGMLRQKSDPGTLLVLNSRRSDACRTIIGGPASADPVRIEITYSE